MSIETVVITGTTPTSTGTKSFESSGFGTPQAAIVTVSFANTTNNPSIHSAIGYGFSDGTRQSFCSILAQDNAGTTNTFRHGSNTNFLVILDGIGSSNVVASFSAWATNGVTLDFTTVDTEAYNIEITLIKK